jgi:hypothetical protein
MGPAQNPVTPIPFVSGMSVDGGINGLKSDPIGFSPIIVLRGARFSPYLSVWFGCIPAQTIFKYCLLLLIQISALFLDLLIALNVRCPNCQIFNHNGHCLRLQPQFRSI